MNRPAPGESSVILCPSSPSQNKFLISGYDANTLILNVVNAEIVQWSIFKSRNSTFPWVQSRSSAMDRFSYVFNMVDTSNARTVEKKTRPHPSILNAFQQHHSSCVNRVERK